MIELSSTCWCWSSSQHNVSLVEREPLHLPGDAASKFGSKAVFAFKQAPKTLVDCPTQLICTFHLLCSLTKLKEHSREICYSKTCYLHYPACHRLPSHQRCLTSPRWPHVHHIFLPESTPLFKTKKSPSEWESEGMRPPKTDAILNIYSIYVYCAKGAHTHQSLCGKLQFNLGRSLAKSVMCNHTCGAKVIISSLIQKNKTMADLGFIRLISLR